MEGVIERTELAPGYTISRVIKGGWQLSEGHSPSATADPVADMFAFVERGIDTFDCADIYTGVEEMIGEFMAANRRLAAPWPVKIHTKYVPDYGELATLTREKVEKVIDRSRERLQQERLDMVQYHWWDYGTPGCIEAAHWLRELQQAGKIDRLSATNFNTDKTRELLDAGIELTTIQVQYSLLDPRAEKALAPLCVERGMHLLCYGTLAGGFLSERWLGEGEPAELDNRSLIKYKLMIDEAGGWDAFQALLSTLKRVADKHGTSLANVASRWILDQPGVAAVIIGARNAAHVERNTELFRFALDDEDRAAITATREQLRVPPLDVFDLERDKEGPHGSIMKYNLNAS